jgi:hypothetical protein
MIVPDTALIAEIVLFGEGFQDTHLLAKKVSLGSGFTFTCNFKLLMFAKYMVVYVPSDIHVSILDFPYVGMHNVLFGSTATE